MSEKQLYTITKKGKEYDCGEIEITTEQWYALLKDPKAKQYIDVLLAFLREPEHKGSCLTVAEKYSNTAKYYSAKVMNFGKWANEHFTNLSFLREDGTNAYWPIPMRYGWDAKGEFIWQLRKELTEALQKYLLIKLTSNFKKFYEEDPAAVRDESYKWDLLQKTADKENLFIANAVKNENIVYIPSATTVYNYLGKEKPNEFNKCLNHLFDESKDLTTRINNFKQEILQLIPSTWNYTANDERAASALLTCKYPEKYTFYMSKVYDCICLYLGIEKEKTGKKYVHFIEIINKITAYLGDEIQNIIQKDIKQFSITPKNLAIQTVFWVMLDYMNKQMKRNSQFTWIPFYMELADKLLEFKSNRKNLINIIQGLDYNYIKSIFDKKDYPVKDIDPFSVFAIFNKKMSEENRLAIANYLKEALDIKVELPMDFCGVPVIHPLMALFFAREEAKTDIQPLWDLFEIAINYNKEDFIDQFNIVRKQKCIKWNITMGLFWIRPYDYIALDANNRAYLSELGFNVFDEKGLNAKNYLDLMDEIDEKIKKHQISEKDYPSISHNAVTDFKEDMEYSKYIDLLKANHNIIFNGAPGTGKTYLAKEIAKEMGATYKMVQFHPSYDYTDFVEGLRPIKDEKGNIGFERKDGVFKEFCRKALIASETSSNEDLFSDLNDNPTVWKVSLGGTGDNPIRTDCLENGWIRIGWNGYGDVEDFNDFEDFKDGGKNILRAFQHTMQIGDIVLSCYSEKEIDAVGIVVGDYEYHDNVSDFQRYRKVKWLVKGIQEDIRSLNRNKVMTLSTIYKLPIKVKDVVDIVNRHEQPKIAHSNTNKNDAPFVFIIDEINRGEISKIFGELFYSIDPGYRGEKGKVQTQYQNLVEDGDVFKDGFYVPENVYIIGTMNDIDRSVESMDFAMRRRFAWQEITAEESAENMGITGELRERMDSLNKVILETEGLGSSYQIGAAMFLKVKETEENVEGNCGMTVESLWDLNLKSLLKEYLRGLPNADNILKEMEDAYFLRNENI